jgi:hypothetical protein
MEITLEETVARLARLVSKSLHGAELVEYRHVSTEERESFYIVRWVRRGEHTSFVQYGTHRACLHEDGQSMLVMGHYTRERHEAESDYKERRR